MSEFNITVEGGSSVRLPTAGKYVDRDIIVTAEGGSEDLDSVLTEQEELIAELQEVLKEKASGGDTDPYEVARKIADRTITEYVDAEITSVGTYAFRGCTELTRVSIPSATSVGGYSFYDCTALAEFDAPALTTIGAYAFYNCAALTEFDGELITYIGSYAFQACTNLSSVSFPSATSVAGYAFSGAPIEHLSLPSMKSMTQSAFRGSKFVSVDFPIVTNIANNAFRAQGYIKSVTFPKVTSTASEAMRNCTALTYVDLPVCTSFGTYTFYDCNNLETLILRTTAKVCTMGNVNVLTNTKIANGEGYVYVPASMVDSYKSATNWSTFASQFRAIEDYPEITGG